MTALLWFGAVFCAVYLYAALAGLALGAIYVWLGFARERMRRKREEMRVIRARLDLLI